MNVIQQIDAHRSIRNFTTDKVDDEVLDKILQASVRASTGGSMQLYSIIVTTDVARREALAGLHLGNDVIRRAPVVLTFCVDTHRLGRWLALHGETTGLENMWGFAMGFSDAMLAAQTALLGAESLGLGGCFLGSTLVGAPGLARFLGCPPSVVPVATLILGHAGETPERTTRLPMQAVVHRETYGEVSNQELETLYRDHAKATLDQFCKVPYVAQAVKAAEIDHLAPYYARLMYPRDLIETCAAYFLAAVQGQGFCSDEQFARTRAVRNACDSGEIGALHPIRQLVFTMALTSGHLDHVLATPPSDAESQLSAFLTERAPTIADELAKQGPFDAKLRSRLYRLFEEFAAVSR